MIEIIIEDFGTVFTVERLVEAAPIVREWRKHRTNPTSVAYRKAIIIRRKGFTDIRLYP